VESSLGTLSWVDARSLATPAGSGWDRPTGGAQPRLGAALHVNAVELEALDPTPAIELLTQLIGTERATAEPEAVIELAALCGQLPLALQVAGARLAVKPHWSVNRLVSQMRGERTRLDSLRHGHLDVRASLSLSYHALHPDTQQLLRRLGDLDLPEAATWTSAALLDTTTTRAEELLEELLDAQLAQATRNDPAGHARYRLHDLVRLFATELAARDDADQLEAARLRTYSSCLHLARAAYRSVCGGDYLTVLGEAPPWRIEQEHTAALVAEPMRWV
jgi:hypothetical protein